MKIDRTAIDQRLQFLADKLSKLKTDDEYRNFLIAFIQEYPLSYFNSIKRNIAYRKLYDFIMNDTKWIDVDVSFNTRCGYVILNKHEYLRCNCTTCRKQLKHRELKPVIILRDNLIEKGIKCWCNSQCQANDPYYCNIISKSLLASKKFHQPRKNKKHKDIVIQYKDTPIIYDDTKSQALIDLYNAHPKSFGYWLELNKDLYDYVYEVTYPIDQTKLNLSTRVAWIMNKFQKFPNCKTCGKPLAYVNVKPNTGWPQTCCHECANKVAAKQTAHSNSERLYRKMQQTEVIPLFTVDELHEHKHDHMYMFKCKCTKCGLVFEGRLDGNFFIRNNYVAYIRCPNCYSLNGAEHKSKEEKQLFEYVKSLCSNYIVLSGHRNIIPPYELDIYVKELNLAFEYNGSYWHQYDEEDPNSIYYHLNKTKLCEEHGIRLVHIFDDEWINENAKTKELIKSIVENPNFFIMTFSKSTDIFYVDRSKFNKCAIPDNYMLIDEQVPKLVNRKVRSLQYRVSDCGQLVYKRLS